MLVGKGYRGHQRRQADLCRQPANRCARSRARPTTASTRPTSATAPRSRDILRDRAARRGHASGRREPCRPLDRRARQSSSRPTSSARSRCSRRRSTIGAALTAKQRDALPLPSCLDRRGVRDCRSTQGVFTEDTPYAPSSPYSASKAAVRPSGPRLARDLWPAGRALELLEQLRALSFPRKADPAGHPQRARGEPLPVYGKGENVRDWLYVEDHARALELVADHAAARREL